MCYLDQQDATRAIPLLTQVVAAEPDNTNARFQLGAAFVKKDQCEEALPWLKTATESSQKHYLLARCYKKLNHPDEAAAELAQVRTQLQDDPARSEASQASPEEARPRPTINPRHVGGRA